MYDDLNKTIMTLIQQGATSAITYDGFGRVSQERRQTATGFAKVDRGWNRLGRLASVSNPYEGASPTGTTTYQYDGLGRVTRITHPDNSIEQTEYRGERSTLTDAAGLKREFVYHALGRLQNVIEAPGVAGFGFSTGYTYDMLDNPTAVSQYPQ